MAEPTDPLSDPWFTTGGLVVHPDAPAGGGGAGNFRAAGSLGAGEPHLPVLPSPDSPAGRYVVTPEPLDTEGVKKNPPPATPTGVTELAKVSDDDNEVDVKVEVLADGSNSRESGQAHTVLLTNGLGPTFPNLFLEGPPKKEKITRLTSKFILVGTLTIQTKYKPGVDRAELSGYGRGTTADDKKNGNTTVGFHEVCHVQDMVASLQSRKVPSFPKVIGKTADEFDKITAKYTADLNAYLEQASEDTHKKTDETGDPTRSQWLAKNP